MQRLIIIILAFVVKNTVADENTCNISDFSGLSYPNYGYCSMVEIICKNFTSAAILLKREKNCYKDNGCEELIISSSVLTKIDDRVIDSNAFCKLLKLTITASNITFINDSAFNSFSDLVLLNLENNHIKYLKFLLDLSNLDSLNLKMNNLREIDAKDFRQLKKLRILNLAQNSIQTLGNSSYLLENLVEFYLNNNNISTLKSNLFSKLTSLRILNLADNEIKVIDGNLLKPLTMLNDLNFANNRIDAINVSDFPTSIRELHLQNNLLRFPNKTMTSIKNNMLNLIDLSGCSISTLENIFTSVASITILRMSNCSISEIVPFAFNSLKQLFSLDLSKNNLKILRANYFAGLERLKELKLEQNQIKIIIFQSFSGLMNLRTLHITVENFTLINRTFEDLQYLRNLNFVYSNIFKVSSGSFSSNLYLDYIKLNNTILQSIGEAAFSNNFNTLQCISSMCENENFDSSNRVFNLSGLSLQFINEGGFQSIRGSTNTNFYFNYNNISSIRKNTFSNSFANVISFNYSGITNIEPNAFQGIEFTQGHNNSIFINNNNISRIKIHSLGNINGLCNLIMSNNSIEIIEDHAFENLQFNIRECQTCLIDLSNNFLSVIQNNTFIGITNVKHVVLDDNNIENIIPGAFNGLSMLPLRYSPSLISIQKNPLSLITRNAFIGISNLYALILSQNMINKIDKGAFNTLNETKILNLSYNDLKVIEKNVFVGLENLENLYLDHNKLQTLMFNSFNGMEYLKILKLSNNQLKSIPVGTFRNVHSLSILELNGNEIEKLKIGVFANLTQLKVLRLDNNKFSTLDTVVLYPLVRLQNLYINNNSFFYIDYYSLKSHLPSLYRISLNFNYFNCTFLTEMLKYFRIKHMNNYELIPNKVFDHLNQEGILCFENENKSFIESEKSKDTSRNLQRSIFSININPNEKNHNNETKSENILKNIANLLEKNEKNLKDNFAELKAIERNNSNSILTFIAFVILLLLVIKTCKMTYFYRIKSAIWKKRRPEIELIDTSEN